MGMAVWGSNIPSSTLLSRTYSFSLLYLRTKKIYPLMERQVVFKRAIQWVISVFNVLTHCCWHLKLSQRLQDSLVAPIALLVYTLLCSLYPSEHEIIHSKFADLAPILVNSYILGTLPPCESLDQKVEWLLTLCRTNFGIKSTINSVYLFGISIAKVLFF